jgi:hypothetical protein
MEKIEKEVVYFEEARKHLSYANSYFGVLENSLNGKRFNNDLKYSLALIALEKYFTALMACYEELPSNHVPIGLFREASQLESELTDSMKQTCVLVGKFEGICSLEDFGYRTPAHTDLEEMTKGIRVIKQLVERRCLALE